MYGATFASLISQRMLSSLKQPASAESRSGFSPMFSSMAFTMLFSWLLSDGLEETWAATMIWLALSTAACAL
jgi:hypothetical protein